MSQGARAHWLLAFAFILTFGLSLPSHAAQGGKSKKKEAPRGTPVLWRDPGDVSALDLLNGPGGEEMKPDLSRLTFVKEEKGGYSKKYRVKDGKGRVWVAKVGKEAQPETAATRLVWTAGYVTEITYLAPRVTIPGKGTFENVRCEARSFSGKRELQGLKILMALIEN